MDILTIVNEWGAWGWMSLGVILMMLEFMIPGTFVVWFGTGAVLTGITVAIFAPMALSWQLFIFVIMSVVCVIFGLSVYAKVFGKNKENANDLKTGAKRFVGQTLTVCEDIKNAKGKVSVGDTVWLAAADEDIEKGSSVIVEDVNGTVLKVRRK
jgi:membrane protein implicated in regulation of membrane protease activity